MLHQVAYLTTATLALLASSALAAPLGNGTRGLSPRVVGGSSLTAAARVLAGDQCPLSSGGTVNANVFVAVKIHEVATLRLKTDVVTDALGNVIGGLVGSLPKPQVIRRTGFLGDIASGISALAGLGSPAVKPGSSQTDTLPLVEPIKAGPGDVVQLGGGVLGSVNAGVGAALTGSGNVNSGELLPIISPGNLGPITLPGQPGSQVITLNAGLAANIELDVQVCLCLSAGVSVSNVPISAALSAQAEADVALYAKATTFADATLNTLGGLLNTAGLVDIDVSLTPVDRTVCGQCSPTQYPTCTGGQCGCADCPAGKKYDATSNSCILTPSGGSQAGKLRARSLPGYWTPALIKGKQAKREDIVKRLTATSGTKTS